MSEGSPHLKFETLRLTHYYHPQANPNFGTAEEKNAHIAGKVPLDRALRTPLLLWDKDKYGSTQCPSSIPEGVPPGSFQGCEI